MKQSCIVDSTKETKYIATSEVTKEVLWLRKFLIGLRVILLTIQPMILFCDNSGIMTSKEKIVPRGNIVVKKYILWKT